MQRANLRKLGAPFASSSTLSSVHTPMYHYRRSRYRLEAAADSTQPQTPPPPVGGRRGRGGEGLPNERLR